MKKKIDDKFIRVVPSKEKVWINDVYYGTIGISQKGHLVASGALSVEDAIIMDETLEGVECEQPLYHRNAEGKVLFDTGIKR